MTGKMAQGKVNLSVMVLIKMDWLLFAKEKMFRCSEHAALCVSSLDLYAKKLYSLPTKDTFYQYLGGRGMCMVGFFFFPSTLST